MRSMMTEIRIVAWPILLQDNVELLNRLRMVVGPGSDVLPS